MCKNVRALYLDNKMSLYQKIKLTCANANKKSKIKYYKFINGN